MTHSHNPPPFPVTTNDRSLLPDHLGRLERLLPLPLPLLHCLLLLLHLLRLLLRRLALRREEILAALEREVQLGWLLGWREGAVGLLLLAALGGRLLALDVLPGEGEGVREIVRERGKETGVNEPDGEGGGSERRMDRGWVMWGEGKGGGRGEERESKAMNQMGETSL